MKIVQLIKRMFEPNIVTNTRTTTAVKNPLVYVKSAEAAMKISAAWRCTSILGGTLGSLNLEYQRKVNDVFVPDEEQAIYNLLRYQPNQSATTYDLIANAVETFLMHGNAYIKIDRTGSNVKALTLITPNTCYYDKVNKVYHIADGENNISGQFKPKEIIHLKNKSLDGGKTGISTIQYAAITLGIATAADLQTNDLLVNGARMKGFLSGDEKSDDGAILGGRTNKQINEAAETVQTKLESGADIIALPDGFKFTPTSMSPVDTQLLQNREFQISEICRYFGVAPDMVFSNTPANYKSAELSQINFYNNTLAPILAMIEAEFNAKLIPVALRSKYRIKFDTAPLYIADITTQASYFKTLMEAGVMSINEVRKQLNKAPIEHGDTQFISCNVAPINSAKINGEPTTTN